MSNAEAAVLIVGIVCLCIFFTAAVLKSGGSGQAYRPRPNYPPLPMWESKHTYPLHCQAVEVVDDKVIKLCLLDYQHKGKHEFIKTIHLDKDEPYDQELRGRQLD